MNPPVTSTLVVSNFTPLKTFLKRQIMADCVLPSHSVFGEFGIVVLNEAVDLGQGSLCSWWAENGVGNNLNVGQTTRVSLSTPFLLRLKVRNLFFLAWYTSWLWSNFSLIPFLCTLHDSLTLHSQLEKFNLPITQNTPALWTKNKAVPQCHLLCQPFIIPLITFSLLTKSRPSWTMENIKN